MINILDIHFDEELFPLFDSTQNLFSSQALHQWFQDLPDSLEKVLTRQEILKGFIQNTQLYKPFSYSKTTFNDVYGYLEVLKNRDRNHFGSSPEWHLFFNRGEMQREAGKLSQLILFLHKVNGFYFATLDMTVFPESFKKKMEWIRSFIAGLEIEYFQKIVRHRGLKIKHITRFSGFRNGENGI